MQQARAQITAAGTSLSGFQFPKSSGGNAPQAGAGAAAPEDDLYT